jgi:hypothetical protein
MSDRRWTSAGPLTMMVLVLLVLLAACVHPTPSAAPASPGLTPTRAASPSGLVSYVFGTVAAGPVCPVERVPPDPSCAPRPVQGVLITASFAGSGEAGRATSGPDGNYRLVIVGYGTVTLTAPAVPGLMGRPAPVTITLAPMESSRVDFLYDTGIR